jgi:hypothetical protein
MGLKTIFNFIYPYTKFNKNKHKLTSPIKFFDPQLAIGHCRNNKSENYNNNSTTNKQTNKQTKTKNKAKNKTKQNKSKEEHNLIILMTCIYNVYALSIFFAHLKKKTCVFFSQEFKVYFPIDVRVN